MAGIELDEAECVRRLACKRIGHLGSSAKALPYVTPVRYRMSGNALVFGASPGPLADLARHGAVACVEVHGVDEHTGAEWAVVATGPLRQTTATSQGWEDGDDWVPAPWGAPQADHLVALDIALLHGFEATTI